MCPPIRKVETRNARNRLDQFATGALSEERGALCHHPGTWLDRARYAMTPGDVRNHFRERRGTQSSVQPVTCQPCIAIRPDIARQRKNWKGSHIPRPQIRIAYRQHPARAVIRPGIINRIVADCVENRLDMATLDHIVTAT